MEKTKRLWPVWNRSDTGNFLLASFDLVWKENQIELLSGPDIYAYTVCVYIYIILFYFDFFFVCFFCAKHLTVGELILPLERCIGRTWTLSGDKLFNRVAYADFINTLIKSFNSHELAWLTLFFFKMYFLKYFKIFL